MVPTGRLKLRETAGFHAELIAYDREEGGPGRESNYITTSVPDPKTMLQELSMALATRAVVRKRRTLLLLDTTRIHLDNVEGLGRFLEIEVPVKDDDESAARALIDRLILGLGYTWDDCIRRSYVDMIEEGTA
jgi:predicted adenylyl cyclase CyaB